MYSPLTPPENAIRLLRLHSRRRSSSPAFTQPDSPPCIECTLFPASRDEEPEYHALSYAWGDPDDLVSIIVNGIRMKVTRNLKTAFEYIQQDDEDVVIWADSLCINQNDPEEKGFQVRLMNQTYKDAAETVVWLGLSDDNMDKLMKFFRTECTTMQERGVLDLILHMATLPSSAHEQYATAEAKVTMSLTPDWESAANNMSLTIALYYEMERLSSRPYWTRTWTIQEYVVSTKIRIQCGSSSIPFNHFLAMLQYFPLMRIYINKKLYRDIQALIIEQGEQAQRSELSKIFFEFINIIPSTEAWNLQGFRRRYQRYQTFPDERDESSQFTLFRLLAKLHVENTSMATDPKDRVFALLNMANDTESLRMFPDYAKDCHAVYTSTARAIIASGDVDLLSLSQRRKADPTLSSWVPDWRIAQKCNHKAQPENDNSKGPTKLGEYKPRISQMSKCAQCKAETSEILRPCGQLPWNTSFAASGTQSFNLHPSIDKIPSEQLSLYGYTIDTIETVAEPFHPGPKGISKIYDQVLRYFDDIERLCKHSDAKFTSTGDDIYNGAKDVRLSACFLVPTADQEAHGAIFFICRATIPYSRAGYEDILEDISRAARNLDAEKNSPEMQSYRNMLGHQRNRRPFLSETGYVGLAPDAAEVGDQLVIFAGGKFPYVLRKGRDGLCRLVGEAHVHGVMYGEFFTQARVVEEFVLN